MWQVNLIAKIKKASQVKTTEVLLLIGGTASEQFEKQR